MASEVTWIEVSSGRVFRVPADHALPIGEAVVRNLQGERLEVDLEALKSFEVPRDQAFQQLRDDVGGLLVGLGQGLRDEVEKLEPSVRDLGDRVRKGVDQAQVADALDVVGDRLKLWARTMRGGSAPAERAQGQDSPSQKLCPACYALVVGTGPCASCDFDLEAEAPITMSPLEYADAERRDCTGCGAPILETARRCSACGARQGRTL